MRPTDAEFVRHTIIALVDIAAKQNIALDRTALLRIDKSYRILEAEQKKPKRIPFTSASSKNAERSTLL